MAPPRGYAALLSLDPRHPNSSTMSTVPAQLESEPDPTDPYARRAQTFPRLSEEMAARVVAYGTEERIPKGTLVFERGQRRVDFFLVLDGSIEIFDVDEHGRPNVFAVHHERQFTGELDLFNERQILVSARTSEDSRVVRVRHLDFRRLVSSEPDIGEIIMRAFILRRVGLIRHRARRRISCSSPASTPAASTTSAERPKHPASSLTPRQGAMTPPAALLFVLSIRHAASMAGMVSVRRRLRTSAVRAARSRRARTASPSVQGRVAAIRTAARSCASSIHSAAASIGMLAASLPRMSNASSAGAPAR